MYPNGELQRENTKQGRLTYHDDYHFRCKEKSGTKAIKRRNIPWNFFIHNQNQIAISVN